MQSDDFLGAMLRISLEESRVEGARRAGEPWALEMSPRWQKACETFYERHDIRTIRFNPQAHGARLDE